MRGLFRLAEVTRLPVKFGVQMAMPVKGTMFV